MTYQAIHLSSSEIHSRTSVFFNNSEEKLEGSQHQHFDPAVERFHKTFPGYGETQLHALPELAHELGLKNVFVKDESTRFGLPAFKILGASWAIHRAVCQRLGLGEQSRELSLADLEASLKSGRFGGEKVRLVSCTEGNWGRATARVAKYLGVLVTIYAPGYMSEYTQNIIRSEGANVEVLKGASYDETIEVVKRDAETTGALLVMDVSWDGYEQIPQWVTEGYSTMLYEADRQVAAVSGGQRPNMVIASVGVGSWAHSVVAHYKAQDPKIKVVTVEPDTAACLKESLHCGKPVSIKTADTIMAGMNCGTVSKIAWPVLRHGTYAAVAVKDIEAHECVQYLQAQQINAGPCGAATMAALKTLCGEVEAHDRKDTVVVLFSTEGMRDYKAPV
ncbi:Hypothetical protein R9X50_00326100 [Acrodontium crateriforme]|uniref:Tryptophan synthase beta chain-like PALP domain-containing protein n=1 Tax=Acrodontium crateriforme TaxID=150365 RepID=A0AAQ3M281_9PEZI|nr:Hypothetical protein R9X50_00326100 [Acrodontium crateriforme]